VNSTKTKSHHPIKKHNKKKAVNALEQVMLLVAIVEPLMTIPQITDIFTHPGHAEVSLLTWEMYLVASAVWLYYGLKMHNKPLILSGLLWVVMEGLVVVGVLLY
jgi:uncharacterized protein with PQ loop repeat